MNDTAVNQVLGELLSAHGWRESGEALVARRYGTAALVLAKEVYAFALNYPVDWQTTTLTNALAALRLVVQVNYSFLTPDTVQQLCAHFSYSWK